MLYCSKTVKQAALQRIQKKSRQTLNPIVSHKGDKHKKIRRNKTIWQRSVETDKCIYIKTVGWVADLTRERNGEQVWKMTQEKLIRQWQIEIKLPQEVKQTRSSDYKIKQAIAWTKTWHLSTYEQQWKLYYNNNNISTL